MLWRRNHSDSREADARRRRAATISKNNATIMSSSSVAMSRLHVSRQQIAPLPVGALFFLLLTTLSRWNSVIVSSPTTDSDTMNSSQAPDTTHPFSSRPTGKLRFDWTNMTLSSDLAKRIHVHQNNCSLPLAPNGTLVSIWPWF